MLQYLRQLVGVRYCGIFLPGNKIKPESKRNNNNNNKIICYVCVMLENLANLSETTLTITMNYVRQRK